MELELNMAQRQGEASSHAKLTEREVIAILESIFAMTPIADVCAEFGVSKCYVSRLLRRANWRCIKHPKERLERWRSYLALPVWQNGKPRCRYYMQRSLNEFEDSFIAKQTNRSNKKHG